MTGESLDQESSTMTSADPPRATSDPNQDSQENDVTNNLTSGQNPDNQGNDVTNCGPTRDSQENDVANHVISSQNWNSQETGNEFIDHVTTSGRDRDRDPSSSSSNRNEAGSRDLPPRANKKHVVWQSDREADVNNTPATPPTLSSHHHTDSVSPALGRARANVDTVVQTDPRSVGSSSSLGAGNKGISRDPPMENNGRVMDPESRGVVSTTDTNHHRAVGKVTRGFHVDAHENTTSGKEDYAAEEDIIDSRGSNGCGGCGGDTTVHNNVADQEAGNRGRGDHNFANGRDVLRSISDNVPGASLLNGDVELEDETALIEDVETEEEKEETVTTPPTPVVVGSDRNFDDCPESHADEESVKTAVTPSTPIVVDNSDNNLCERPAGNATDRVCETESPGGVDVTPTKALLLKRRPASAGSVGLTTREAQFSGGGASSLEESHRPSTATAALSFLPRRLSLPLSNNSNQRVSSPAHETSNAGPCFGDHRGASTNAALPRDAIEGQKNGKKKSQKVVLVSYVELEDPTSQAKGTEEVSKHLQERDREAAERTEEVKGKAASDRLRDKPPRGGSSSRRRPWTGGWTRAEERRGRGGRGRPSSGRPWTSDGTSGLVGEQRRGSRLSPGRPTSSSMAKTRPIRDMTFSKEELHRALPARSTFSCHDRALKAAACDGADGKSIPRRRLLVFHHREEEEEAARKKEEKRKASLLPPPPLIKEPDGENGDGEMKEAEKENGQEAEDNNTTKPEDLLKSAAFSLQSFGDRAKRRRSTAANAANAGPLPVECRPLELYLTYVRDQPGEYRHMVAKALTSGAAAHLHPSSHPGDNCHTDRLVRMGKLFQERQRGGPPVERCEEVLKAAYALKPRYADPKRFAKQSKDKSPLLQGLGMARKQSTAPNFQRKESSGAALSGGDETGGGSKSSSAKAGQRTKPGTEAERAAEHLLEVEKRRLKAEEWASGVTTDQLTRAKVQVLKELGQDERELSQWWLAFKTCFYLRPKKL